jgi:hypothetical protein
MVALAPPGVSVLREPTPINSFRISAKMKQLKGFIFVN